MKYADVMKRFDERFLKEFFSVDCTCGIFHATNLKAFLTSELDSQEERFRGIVEGLMFVTNSSVEDYTREFKGWNAFRESLLTALTEANKVI